MNIVSGKRMKPVRVVIYGTEGIGKTTFCSMFPKPLFIDTEGGTDEYDLDRVPVSDWRELIDTVMECRTCGYGTIVLDSADWAETMCADYVCQQHRWSSISQPEYGRGYVELSKEFTGLIDALQAVRESGRNVVVTAHSQIVHFDQPDEMGGYDRYEMKLDKRDKPKLQEWADTVIFANFKTNVETDGKGKSVARGNRRVMYLTHDATHDGKNRWGLDGMHDLDFSVIERFVPGACSDGLGSLWNEVKRLAERDGVELEEIRRAACAFGHRRLSEALEDYEPDYVRAIAANWNAFVNKIEEMRSEDLPL